MCAPCTHPQHDDSPTIELCLPTASYRHGAQRYTSERRDLARQDESRFGVMLALPRLTAGWQARPGALQPLVEQVEEAVEADAETIERGEIVGTRSGDTKRRRCASNSDKAREVGLKYDMGVPLFGTEGEYGWQDMFPGRQYACSMSSEQYDARVCRFHSSRRDHDAQKFRNANKNGCVVDATTYLGKSNSTEGYRHYTKSSQKRYEAG